MRAGLKQAREVSPNAGALVEGIVQAPVLAVEL